MHDKKSSESSVSSEPSIPNLLNIYSIDDDLKNKLKELSCHQLEQLAKAANRAKREKFPHYQKKHVGVAPRLRKSFPDQKTLIEFFSTMAPCKSKQLLLRQFFYCGRVGEVNTMTYNKDTKLVRIETEKEGGVRIDYIPFIEGTEELFLCGEVSKDSLRNFFTRHRKHLQSLYDEVYHVTTDKKHFRRLTTHSLRVTASNWFREHTKSEFKQKMFLRHSIKHAYGATGCYMEYSEPDMRKDLNECFAHLVKALL